MFRSQFPLPGSPRRGIDADARPKPAKMTALMTTHFDEVWTAAQSVRATFLWDWLAGTRTRVGVPDSCSLSGRRQKR